MLNSTKAVVITNDGDLIILTDKGNELLREYRKKLLYSDTYESYANFFF